MTEQDIAHVDPTRLARQLNRCRQHGLDDLDLNLHGKPAVPEAEIANLAYLARTYCAAVGVTAPTRGATILRLIQDGLAAYAEYGDQDDSVFVKQFFFERPQATGTSAPADRRDESPASGSPPAVLKTRKGARIKDLATELHLSEKRLAELRDAAFIRFATFLIAFVAEVSHAVPAVEERELVARATPPSPPSPQPHDPATRNGLRMPRLPLRSWVGLGLAGLVVVSGLFMAFLLLNHTGTARTPSQATATNVTSHYQPGKTYPETAGEFGVPTFTDPRTVSGAGPKIQSYQPVQVACKVLAPSIPSVSPDGYWYLITSSPWSGRYFAAANAFMNGDHIGQTTLLHNTDFAVPNCPDNT